MKDNLSAEYVRECLNYDKETGVFIWKQRPLSHFVDVGHMKTWNTGNAGKIAGYISKVGYRHIGVNFREYLAHRLAWVIVNGVWPEGRLDHKDRNRSNNSWMNIRSATDSQNCCNRGTQSNNISGYTGVCRWKHKWQAYVNVNGLRVWNKLFDTIEEAVYFRNYAAQYYHKEFARTA